MRITRKPLARILTGGFALAAATALVLPGIAAADETNKGGTTTEDSSGSGSSSGSLDELAIAGGLGDFLGAMKKIATGEINLDTIGACVTDEFGKDVPNGNPIEIIINCIAGADGDDTENGQDVVDTKDSQQS